MSESAATASTGKGKGRKAPPVEVPIQISEELLASVEALLFSVDRPLNWAKIAAAAGLIDEEAARKDEHAAELADEGVVEGGKRRASGPAGIIREGIARLNTVYEQSGRAFRIEQVAGGYRVMTLSKHAPMLERYHGTRERTTLSKAAIETLAIVAYKQPLTRAGLEAIRGVACGDILRALLDRRLVTIAGRAEEVGRPILYGTTKRFLETFGLSSLKDLPTVEELRMRARGASAEPESTDSEPS